MMEVTSMNKAKIKIWDREFELEVIYDCYSDEKVTSNQLESLESFIKSETEIADSLDKVKGYCLLNNKQEIGSDEIENIFKYVAPKYIYVPREEKKHVVSVMCNYRFDTENGIAIIFENEKFLKIGKQDIIL